jgi:thiol-disulfide isomerase/thioredoxin
MSTTKQQSNKKQESNKGLIYWIGGGVIGLGLIVWLAFSIAGETEVDDAIGFGDPTVEGTGLPFFESSAADPAVGVIAPTVTGADWDSNEYTIGPDGRAKIIVMLAHWCPHCQAEVPVIQDWVDAGGVPEGVDLYGVTVLTNRLRQSSTWPPQEWLEGEGWTSPTIMDDEAGSIVTAYGLTSTPTYVVLDGDNNNLGRFAGEIGVSGLDTLAALAVGSLDS